MSMNFIEESFKSIGINVILGVVGRFNKYANFVALKHPFFFKLSGLLKFSCKMLSSFVDFLDPLF